MTDQHPHLRIVRDAHPQRDELADIMLSVQGIAHLLEPFGQRAGDPQSLPYIVTSMAEVLEAEERLDDCLLPLRTCLVPLRWALHSLAEAIQDGNPPDDAEEILELAAFQLQVLTGELRKELADAIPALQGSAV